MCAWLMSLFLTIFQFGCDFFCILFNFVSINYVIRFLYVDKKKALDLSFFEYLPRFIGLVLCGNDDKIRSFHCCLLTKILKKKTLACAKK